LADLITERLFKSIDLQKTYMNTLTSTYVQRGMIPIIGGSDRETIEKALYSLPLIQKDEAKVAWIRNTNEIEHVALSAAALTQSAAGTRIEKLGEVPWAFDEKGLLIPWRVT
jgi:DNA replication protein DnaD